MIFPIGDTQIKGGHKPIVSYTLIAINILVFVYQLSLPINAQDNFVMHYGSIPKEIVSGQDWFTLFTCMFLHAGFMHILGNMLFLWVFADNIEATIGSSKFLIFYLLGGIVASLFHVFLNSGSLVPCVGASGAISACLGAYMVMFPKSKIKMWAFVVFQFWVPAILFLGLWGIQQFIASIGSLSTFNLEKAGVAYWAHLGGFIFGIIAGFYFKKNINPYNTNVRYRKF